MEAVASGRAPQDDVARLLLERQARLVAWQIAGERLSVWLKALTVGVGVCIAGVIAALLATLAWQASRSRDLIVEPFSVPPSMAEAGLTGEVVASRLLDRMTAMQVAVQSQRAAPSFSRNWEGDVKIAIPQTGITLGELDRQLRTWLGHETHVRGEVVMHGPDTLAVTVRVGQATGETFRGPPADFDLLVEHAGAAAFGKTELFRYGVWLRQAGRLDESAAAMRRLTESGPPAERAWGYVGLSNSSRDTEGLEASLRYSREAQRLAPHQLLAPTVISSTELELGHMEAARRAAKQALRNANPRGEALDFLLIRGISAGNVAFIDGDYATGLRHWAGASTMSTAAPNRNRMLQMVRARLNQHDLSAARADLRSPLATAEFPTPSLQLDALAMRLIGRAIDGDVAGVQRERAEAEAMAARWPALMDRLSRYIYPLAAWSMAETGDLAGAQALIEPTPLDSYDVVLMRGRIAARANRPDEADLWFARALAMAPRSPQAEALWAETLLVRGEADTAIERAKAAHRKGPRFADPLEVWGEALLAKGDARGAARKFAAAGKLAPNWGRLHLKWALALAKAGDAAGARAHLALAGRLDLTAAERIELQRTRL